MKLWDNCKRNCRTFYDKEKHSRITQSIPTFWSIIIILVGITIFVLIDFNFKSLPTGLLKSDEKDHPNEFISERAFENLRQLIKNGPRVAGSEANEVSAVFFIRNVILNIISEKNSIHNIEYSVQSESGSYFVDDGYGTTCVYQGLQNIIVKLRPANGSEPSNSLLLNVHFDSVQTSPGASDDGSMTVVLLEILRLLSKSKETLQHSIIFLFNGCEEYNLQGSHAFITKHKWAKNVRAFLNLDSAGNGVREIMFQAGPKHPWLMNYYRKTAKHPYASAVGEELFQANLVPSDTDFRQFRDYGKIPGMDFAYNTNGYMYHTKYDSLDTVSLGSLQHTGDNILALVIELGNADELKNVKNHEDGKVIFFDFLNWFLVYYTETVGIIINSCVSVASIIIMCWSIWAFSHGREYDKVELIKEFGYTIIIQVVTLGIGIGLLIVLAIIYDAVGRSMSWYSSTYLIFGLYFSPLFFVLTFFPALYLKFRKVKTISLAHQVQLFFYAQNFFLILFLIAMTAMEIRSAFIIMIPVFFYTIFSLIGTITKSINKDTLWIYLHLFGQILPFMFFISMALTFYGTFISLTARSGPTSNPEFIIAIFSIFVGILLIGFLMPLSLLCRHPFLVSIFFLITTIIGIILMATPIGFPYTEKTAPQRFSVQHVNRIIHNGIDVRTNSGFYLHPLDRHYSSYFEDFLDVSEIQILDTECKNQMYCGLPFYRIGQFESVSKAHWINAPSPKFTIPTTMNNLKIDELGSSNTIRVSFSISGPDHMNMYISPNKNVKIIDWNLSETIPKSGRKWNDRNVHFISFFHGNNPKPFECSIDLQNSDEQNNSTLLTIALVGHYMHQDDDITDEFNNFIYKFPKWSAVSYWVSSYESWDL